MFFQQGRLHKILFPDQLWHLVLNRMQTPDGNLLIVGAYAPHEGHTVSDYNLFLPTLQAVLDQNTCKRRIILGDLNANVARNTPGITEKFGLHHYHSRNGRLLDHFCQHKNLIIAKSYFKSGL